MANECCNEDRDFVSYFFQKNGDAYIDAITKMQAEYAQKLGEMYGCVGEDVKLRLTCFQSKILDPCRLSPTLATVPQFDFLGTLMAAFSGLNIDLCEHCEKITKYYDFIQSMEQHWNGLEVDDKTVLDVAIQMMATLEAMIYPLFLKLSQYIIQISSTPNQQNKENEPEIMMTRFHRIVEVVSLQIALIGESCVKTLGKSNCTTWEILEKDSRRIASQARDAKNCLAWSMKAVASVLLYYYITRCNAGVCGPVTCEQEECRLKQLAEESELRIKEQTSQAEARIQRQVEEFETRVRTVSRTAIDTATDIQEKAQKVEKGTQGSEAGGSVLLETKKKTKTSSKKSSKKTSKKTSKKSSKKSSKKTSKKSSKKKKKVEEKDSNSNSSAGSKGDTKSKSKSKEKKKSKAKSNESVEPKADFESTVTQGNLKSGSPAGKDFVDYFFSKDGLKYIAIMAELKKKYHTKCTRILKGLNSADREDATKFLEKLHSLRKVEPITKEVTLYKYMFYDQLNAEIKEFNIEMDEIMTLLQKYEDYAKGMMKHWEYKVQKTPGKLEPSHVVDGGTQLMATTMALVYPVFIKLSEFLIAITKRAESNVLKYPPQIVLEKCSRLVEIVVLEMVAISLSSISTFGDITEVSDDDMKKATNEMTVQARFAKNSVAWGIKSLSPLVFLYFLTANFPKVAEEVNTSLKSESATNISKKISKKSKKKKKEKEKETKKEEESVQSAKPSESLLPDAPIGDHAIDHKNDKIYLKPAKTYDFVDYFFQKEGEAYLKFLTDMLQNYEKLCNDTLPNSGSKIKKRAGDFLLRVHDARKVQPDGRGKDIPSLHFVTELQACFAGLEVDLMEAITMLAKYHDFIKNMISHWKERLSSGQELDKDAVVEVSVQMMASVLAMAYPVFIKIADTVSKLVTGLAESVKLKSDPNKIVDRLHLFVELLTSEIAAIGISATKVMTKLPGITKETLREQEEKLAAQTKYANNSIAWAMKSLGPLLLYYYLQCEVSHAD